MSLHPMTWREIRIALGAGLVVLLGMRGFLGSTVLLLSGYGGEAAGVALVTVLVCYILMAWALA